MSVLGPFSDRCPELKQAGWFEHIVMGPAKAVIYTTLTFDDERVQSALRRFFASLAQRDDTRLPPATPHSASNADELSESTMAAREVRHKSSPTTPPA